MEERKRRIGKIDSLSPSLKRRKIANRQPRGKALNGVRRF